MYESVTDCHPPLTIRKEKQKMRFVPIGLYDDDDRGLYYMGPSDYSDKNYDGIELRKDRKGMPVVISRSRKTAPMMWKVSYGFSQIFFRTFDEAVEFCSSRGMELVKGQVDK